MRNKFLQTVGRQAAYGVARQQLRQGGMLDLKLGAALLRDGRVSAGAKMTALALGVAAVFLIDLLELPLEAVLAVMLPILGMGINIAVDGVEYVAGSLLIAAALLPRLAPRAVVERIRAERDGVLAPVTVAVPSHRRR